MFVETTTRSRFFVIQWSAGTRYAMLLPTPVPPSRAATLSSLNARATSRAIITWPALASCPFIALDNAPPSESAASTASMSMGFSDSRAKGSTTA